MLVISASAIRTRTTYHVYTRDNALDGDDVVLHGASLCHTNLDQILHIEAKEALTGTARAALALGPVASVGMPLEDPGGQLRDLIRLLPLDGALVALVVEWLARRRVPLNGAVSHARNKVHSAQREACGVGRSRRGCGR